MRSPGNPFMETVCHLGKRRLRGNKVSLLTLHHGLWWQRSPRRSSVWSSLRLKKLIKVWGNNTAKDNSPDGEKIPESQQGEAARRSLRRRRKPGAHRHTRWSEPQDSQDYTFWEVRKQARASLRRHRDQEWRSPQKGCRSQRQRWMCSNDSESWQLHNILL